MNIRIYPPEEMIDGAVRLPLSKSFANRQLIINRLAGVATAAFDPGVAGTDMRTLQQILTRPTLEGTIDVADAGTAMRFLTALAAATEGTSVTLTGSERMCRRPIGPLVDALRRCGASVAYAGEEGFPPLKIEGRKLRAPGKIEVDASVSSQFVSALLMIAPTMESGIVVELEGPVKSRPYIALTVDMMQRRGIAVEIDASTITVSPGSYNGAALAPELDWSALAFWAELVAVTAGFIFVPGLNPASAQGDRRVLDLFAQLGVDEGEADEEDDDDDDGHAPRTPGEGVQLCGSPELTPRLNYDFTECPDLAQAAAVTCCLIGVPFHFTGLQTLAIKETDRIEALITEMARIGLRLSSQTPGSLDWEGERHPVAEQPVFRSHGDHRMAMALAPVAAFIPGIVIEDAECVDKSYPGFWDELRKVGFTLMDAAEPAAENDDEA